MLVKSENLVALFAVPGAMLHAWEAEAFQRVLEPQI